MPSSRPRELVSPTTRRVFREALMAWPLRDLVTEFNAVGIAQAQPDAADEAGPRRRLIDRFYAGIDFGDPQSVQKVFVVFGQVIRARARVLADHARQPEAVIHQAALDKLMRCLAADGYGYSRSTIRPESAELRLAFLLRDGDTHFSETGLQRLVERLQSVAKDDPALAVGAARDVCESCCEFILAARAQEEELPRSFSDLLDRTLDKLQLLPEQAQSSGRRAGPVRRVLETVSELCDGLDALSTMYAKPSNKTALTSRHALLAVDAAGTLARFLLATHRDKAIA